MAKIRLRSRDSENQNKGVTFVHAIKGERLNKRKNIYKILLVLSVLLDIYLTIRLLN